MTPAETDQTRPPDDAAANELRQADVLDALLLQQGERVCELELHLEQQLDELATSLEAGLQNFSEREEAMRRESSEIDHRLQECVRREVESRRQRRQIARELRARKAELERRGAEPAPGGSAVADGQSAPPQTGDGESVDSFELAFLKEELENQRTAAEEAQRQLAELRQSVGANPDQDSARLADDLQQRLDMALEDIRELREENRNLQPRSQAATEPSNSGLNWEAQKAQMISQLENDSGDGSELPDHATVGRIRELERQLEEREFEICQLRESRDGESDAALAIPVAAILENDELILQEREKLVAIQQEWREKLRMSEIEISVERAKLARERTKLDDQLQAMEQEIRQQGPPSDETSDGKGKQVSQGRWLARLGLADS